MKWRGLIWLAGTLAVAAGCGKWADDLACGDQGCEFTREEWATIRSLALICTPEQIAADLPCGDIPGDSSNRYLPFIPGTNTLKPDAIDDPVVKLGRQLYYEKRLSGVASGVDVVGIQGYAGRAAVGSTINISCATCHDPTNYGTDMTSQPRTVSIGAGWYDVNGQQTLNVARQQALDPDGKVRSYLYWNGRTDTVWAQAAQVMESGVSMNGHRLRTFWLVSQHYPDYFSIFADSAEDHAGKVRQLAATVKFPAEPEKASKQTYAEIFATLPSEADRTTVTRVHVNVAKAIAAYEWLLFSDHSRFDKFVKEGPTSGELGPAAKRGLKVFIGKGSCIDCHSGPLLSDGKVHNIGIPQVGPGVPTVAWCADPRADKKLCDCVSSSTKTCLPWGAQSGAFKRFGEFRRESEFGDNEAERMAASQPDPGAFDSLIGAWRTPSLRDVAMTGPYMHDGLYATLDEVIWHYDQAEGGGTGQPEGRDAGVVGAGRSVLSPLNLSAAERADLVAFLSSLTGTRRNSPILSDPQLPSIPTPPAPAPVDAGTVAVDGGTSEDVGP